MGDIVDRLFDRGVKPGEPSIGVDVSRGVVTVTVGGPDGATAQTYPASVALRLALAWGDGARRALEASEADAAVEGGVVAGTAPLRVVEAATPGPPGPKAAAAPAVKPPAKARPKAAPANAS